MSALGIVMTNRPWRVWVARALFQVVLCFILTSCSPSAGPRIAAPSKGIVEEFDFGRISEGKKVTHVFYISNSAKEPVSILKTVSSCGCTVATTKTSEISAGGMAEVEVNLNTSGKSGETNANVVVMLSDSTERRLALRGYVYSPNLKLIDFGTVSDASLAIGSTELLWPYESFEILQILYDKNLFQVDVKNYPSEGMSNIKVSLVRGIGPGEFSSSIKILTDDVDQSEYVLPVKGYIEYPIELQEYTIAAGNVIRGKPVWVKAILTIQGTVPLEISRVTYLSGLPGEWRLEKVSQSDYVLHFQLVPPDDPMKLVAVSRLQVDAAAGSFTRKFEIEAMGVIAAAPNIGS